ncbi:UPF0692 protein CG33108 [Sergentomyia squamirostris]
MSHNIIPIPPPAPIVNTSTLPSTPPYAYLTVGVPSAVQECRWAADSPELQISCFFSCVSERKPPKKCVYHQLAPILQQGPTCGFVTISMLLRGNPSADTLFRQAKARGFTAMGEMFSAGNLMEVLKSQQEFSGQCYLFEGDLNCDEIRREIMSGACLIVPYDSDVNHAPCLKSGHKAHWALIVGYLIDDNDQFFVIARQGKSRHLGIWSLSKLAASNANLKEFSQPKNYADADFILSEGGIAGPRGLCRRTIVIHLDVNGNTTNSGDIHGTQFCFNSSS